MITLTDLKNLVKKPLSKAIHLLQSAHLTPHLVSYIQIKKQLGFPLSDEENRLEAQSPGSVLNQELALYRMSLEAQAIFNEILANLENENQIRRAILDYIEDFRVLKEQAFRGHQYPQMTQEQLVSLWGEGDYFKMQAILSQSKVEEIEHWFKHVTDTKTRATLLDSMERRYRLIDENLMTIERMKQERGGMSVKQREAFDETRENYLKHLERSTFSERLKHLPDIITSKDEKVLIQDAKRQELNEDFFGGKLTQRQEFQKTKFEEQGNKSTKDNWRLKAHVDPALKAQKWQKKESVLKFEEDLNIQLERYDQQAPDSYFTPQQRETVYKILDVTYHIEDNGIEKSLGELQPLLQKAHHLLQGEKVQEIRQSIERGLEKIFDIPSAAEKKEQEEVAMKEEEQIAEETVESQSHVEEFVSKMQQTVETVQHDNKDELIQAIDEARENLELEDEKDELLETLQEQIQKSAADQDSAGEKQALQNIVKEFSGCFLNDPEYKENDAIIVIYKQLKGSPLIEQASLPDELDTTTIKPSSP